MLAVAAWICLVLVFIWIVLQAYLHKKIRAKRFGEQQCEVKTLPNGEVIIKTENDLYFHALDEASIPVLVSKEEGERLWSLED